jgi:hypothetical protein
LAIGKYRPDIGPGAAFSYPPEVRRPIVFSDAAP